MIAQLSSQNLQSSSRRRRKTGTLVDDGPDGPDGLSDHGQTTDSSGDGDVNLPGEQQQTDQHMWVFLSTKEAETKLRKIEKMVRW